MHEHLLGLARLKRNAQRLEDFRKIGGGANVDDYQKLIEELLTFIDDLIADMSDKESNTTIERDEI